MGNGDFDLSYPQLNPQRTQCATSSHMDTSSTLPHILANYVTVIDHFRNISSLCPDSADLSSIYSTKTVSGLNSLVCEYSSAILVGSAGCKLDGCVDAVDSG